MRMMKASVGGKPTEASPSTATTKRSPSLTKTIIIDSSDDESNVGNKRSRSSHPSNSPQTAKRTAPSSPASTWNSSQSMTTFFKKSPSSVAKSGPVASPVKRAPATRTPAAGTRKPVVVLESSESESDTTSMVLPSSFVESKLQKWFFQHVRHPSPTPLELDSLRKSTRLPADDILDRLSEFSRKYQSNPSLMEVDWNRVASTPVKITHGEVLKVLDAWEARKLGNASFEDDEDDAEMAGGDNGGVVDGKRAIKTEPRLATMSDVKPPIKPKRTVISSPAKPEPSTSSSVASTVTTTTTTTTTATAVLPSVKSTSVSLVGTQPIVSKEKTLVSSEGPTRPSPPASSLLSVPPLPRPAVPPRPAIPSPIINLKPTLPPNYQPLKPPYSITPKPIALGKSPSKEDTAAVVRRSSSAASTKSNSQKSGKSTTSASTPVKLSKTSSGASSKSKLSNGSSGGRGSVASAAKKEKPNGNSVLGKRSHPENNNTDDDDDDNDDDDGSTSEDDLPLPVFSQRVSTTSNGTAFVSAGEHTAGGERTKKKRIISSLHAAAEEDGDNPEIKHTLSQSTGVVGSQKSSKRSPVGAATPAYESSSSSELQYNDGLGMGGNDDVMRMVQSTTTIGDRSSSVMMSDTEHSNSNSLPPATRGRGRPPRNAKQRAEVQLLATQIGMNGRASVMSKEDKVSKAVSAAQRAAVKQKHKDDLKLKWNFYHGHGNLFAPKPVEECDYDSAVDIDDTHWRLQLQSQRLDEYNDVSRKEKIFFKLWNTHVVALRSIPTSKLQFILRQFIDRHLPTIVSQGLMTQLHLHILHMTDRNVMPRDHASAFLFYIDGKAKGTDYATSEEASSHPLGGRVKREEEHEDSDGDEEEETLGDDPLTETTSESSSEDEERNVTKFLQLRNAGKLPKDPPPENEEEKDEEEEEEEEADVSSEAENAGEREEEAEEEGSEDDPMEVADGNSFRDKERTESDVSEIDLNASQLS